MVKAGMAHAWAVGQARKSGLDEEILREAETFSFICSVFEAHVRDVLKKPKDCSLNIQIVQDYANSEHIKRYENCDLSCEKAYFRNRYFDESGESLNLWKDGMNFRLADKSAGVRDTLLSPEATF